MRIQYQSEFHRTGRIDLDRTVLYSNRESHPPEIGTLCRIPSAGTVFRVSQELDPNGSVAPGSCAGSLCDVSLGPIMAYAALVLPAGSCRPASSRLFLLWDAVVPGESVTMAAAPRLRCHETIQLREKRRFARHRREVSCLFWTISNIAVSPLGARLDTMSAESGVGLPPAAG